jgi:hypothetical protein
MPARHCPKCDEDWPVRDEYMACPADDHPTTFSAHRQPLATDDARWLRNHLLAERVYLEHEQRRMQEGRLSPEAEGRLEARRVIENTRELEAQLAR